MILISAPVARRKRIPLTPLIDVIFILIMFFLLSSTFGIWRPLSVSRQRPVAAAPAAEEIPQRAAAVFIVVRSGLAEGRAELTVNGVDLAFEDLAGELDRLAARGAEHALVVPDRETDFQRVVTILDEARGSRLKRVSLHLD